MALLAAAGTALIALTPWLVTWGRRHRRKASQGGTVATSQAGELWKTSMALIERLQEENSKLVLQRDRLIGLLDDKIAPTLETVATTQRRDGETLAVILSLLEGQTHAPAAPAGHD